MEQNLIRDLKKGEKSYKSYLRQVTSRFKFKKVETEDIIKVISSMKPKSSTGAQLMSSKLLKHCKHELSPILAHIINMSLTQGVFPGELKIAKVIPIFKDEDPHSFNNYRPISLLPTLCKNKQSEILLTLSTTPTLIPYSNP